MSGFYTPALRATALFGATLLAVGCGPREEPAGPAHPERLNGAWVAQFHESYTPRLTSSAPSTVIRGRVTLIPNEGGRLVRGFRGVPTHFGTYSADLHAFGIPAGTSVPTLAIRLTAADSVQIAFDPQEPIPLHGSGVLRGDSILGRWHTEGGRNVGGMGGTFLFRRSR